MEKKGSVNKTSSPLTYSLILAAFFISIFFLPLASAVQVTMDSNFSQGQTLLAVVSGTFVDQITPNNVAFYEQGHIPVPVTYDVLNINGDFYIYALLTGKAQGNDYSMNISGVRYLKATQIVKNPIIANFSITNETAAFSIDPGVVSTPGDFFVNLQNLEDNAITVDISMNSSNSSITYDTPLVLKTGEKKRVDFSVADVSATGLVSIRFSSGNYSYSLPVYLSNTTIPSTNEPGLDFQPSNAYVSIASGSEISKILYLTNTGNTDLNNISFSVSAILVPYVAIYSFPASLNSGDSKQVQINISAPNKTSSVEGLVTAYSGNVTANLDLLLNFTSGFIPVNNATGTGNNTNPSIVTTCSDLKGIVCSADEQCTGDIIVAKDGDCCMASCEIPQQSSTGSWIGWALLVLVLLLAFWFYKKKYKKVAPKKPF